MSNITKPCFLDFPLGGRSNCMLTGVSAAGCSAGTFDDSPAIYRRVLAIIHKVPQGRQKPGGKLQPSPSVLGFDIDLPRKSSKQFNRPMLFINERKTAFYFLKWPSKP
jgi:hypothetical protein